MDADFIRNRISALRIQKGISEYKMSLDLGHSKSYLQSISSGRALPSLSEFLYICEYFQITPKDFFDESQQDPVMITELKKIAATLNTEDLQALICVANRLSKK